MEFVMQSGKSDSKQPRAWLLWAIGALLAGLSLGGFSLELRGATEPPAPADGPRFQLTLEGGSSLIVELLDQQFEWSDILPNGAVRARTIRFADVKRLKIGSEGLSDQVLQVQQWLEDLSSDQYLLRENAEAELSNSATAMRFRHLIEQFAVGDEYELSYRIGRILEAHRKAGNNPAVAVNLPANSFDRLELMDGSQLTGDCGQFKVEGSFRNRTIGLNRGIVVSLVRTDSSGADGPQRPITETDSTGLNRIEIFQKHSGFFYLPHQTLIDFESAANEEELPLRFDVSTLYQGKGLLLGSERPGYIGISGYRFRSDFPPTGNSVCVFEAVGNAFQRFKGVLEIRFCLPDQPHIPAGVHEFGLFLSRIDNPRDFIMEAYDWSGGLLGTVEASDTQTVFLGIKSPEPIAFLRVLSNPYLFSIKRKIDEDFCADDMLFSSPVPLISTPIKTAPASQKTAQSGLIQLNDGNRMMGSLVSFGEGLGLRMEEFPEGPAEFGINREEIRSVRFLNQENPIPKGRRVWMARTKGGSILKINPKDDFATELFGGLAIPRENLVAMWLAPNQQRYPWVLPGSPNLNFPALVFPSCLLELRNLSWTPHGFTWENSNKLEQDLWIRASLDGEANSRGPRNPDYEDPTPNLSEIDFDGTSIEQIPTLWLQSPQFQQANAGHIRLSDGQLLILGGTENFRVLEFSANSITVGWQDLTEKFPMESISSILFPEN
jgi:hypothetical protein